MEGFLVLTFVAVGSVKAMLLLIECKYKCLAVLAPGLSNVKVNSGKEYTPVKTSDDHNSSDDDDDKHKKHNRSTRYDVFLTYIFSKFTNNRVSNRIHAYWPLGG